MTLDGALSPRKAREALGPVGRLLYDAAPRSIWERDTETLPPALRIKRRRYREFARTHVAPLALPADLNPSSFDARELFVQAAREGLQTEFLPWPFGTMSITAAVHALLLGPALKAEELCASCSGLGLALLAHDLGTAPLFITGRLADLAWLRRIYGEIRAGEPAIAAFAITEPGAGSDVEDTKGAAAARLSCRARRAEGGFVLSGRKCFITNGAIARWITLFAAEEGRGIESWSCFLLRAPEKGLSIGRSERKMGQRAADATELVLDDLFVPDDRIIGPVGGGWAISRNVLNYSRPVVGAIALGIARGAFEAAVDFCQRTRFGGERLLKDPGVQATLADMLAKLSAMRATVWHAVRYRRPFQAASSIAKVFCSDTAWEVSTSAMSLLGNHGFLHSERVEKAARDARLTQIYEGTNQINRLAIFESQLGAEFPELG